MSMIVFPHALDPRTRLDIEARNPQVGGCGCQPRRSTTDMRWSICDYHEGYDAALEQHASAWSL